MRFRLFLTLLSCFFLIGECLASPVSGDRNLDLILVLEGPPVSAVASSAPGPSLYKGIRTKKQARVSHLLEHRASLERQQDQVVRRLTALSPQVHVLRRFTGLLNGVAVRVPPDFRDQIARWPEVVAIAPSRRHKLFLNESNPLMNAPEAWQAVGGDTRAGEGIKIAVVDTGIDATHPMFEDDGFEAPEGFPMGDSEFTNNKVIVARVFGAFNDAPEDSTPRDQDGHGTHSAACAAGNLNTPSPLGPISGVAPQAYLGNYKIFTNEFAATDQIIDALEAAVEDGMDIINMSLGSEEYVETPLDPEALAIRNAIASGVVLVAAAGNEGRTESIGSPGQIPEVITVGSVSNGHAGSGPSDRTEASMNVYVDGERVIADEQVILGEDGDYLSDPVAGRFSIVDADNLDGDGYGGEDDGAVCEDLPPESATGKWVLVQRYDCTFSSKIDRVQAAGGLGALIYNSADADGGSNIPVQFPSVPGTTLPSYFIARDAGLEIKEFLRQADTVEVEFVAPKPSEWNQEPFEVSSFSSLGPTVDYTIKPDIMAIGGGSYAATQNDVPTGAPSGNRFQISGFEFISGTSFACPRVAGAAALIQQVHPDWTPDQIKSALVISADRPEPMSEEPTMTRGAGHVNAERAVQTPLLVTPPTLSFCRQMIAEQTTIQRDIVIENVSESEQTVTLSVEPRNPDLLVSQQVEPAAITLSPSEEVTATVTLVFDAPVSFADEQDLDGDVVLAVNGLDGSLRVPFWARAIHVPEPVGRVLLIDDDSNFGSEEHYIDAVERAGYGYTVWDKIQIDQYPSHKYMLNFDTVLMFMATTSLNTVSANELPNAYNERVRLNTELTKYLARGGSLLVSGQDWSDWGNNEQHETPFDQHVMHIRRFGHDFHADTIEGIVGNPIAEGIGTQSLVFDERPDGEDNFDGFEDFVDTITLDATDIADPAFGSNGRMSRVVGISVDSCSYRAVFLAFPLERLDFEPMARIIENSLDWMNEEEGETLSIVSIEPAAQPDTEKRVTATVVATGLNFSVGNHVSLDHINLPITSTEICGDLEVVIPTGLPDGLYDVTLSTPDGQETTLPDVFKVGKGDEPTNVIDWAIYR